MTDKKLEKKAEEMRKAAIGGGEKIDEKKIDKPQTEKHEKPVTVKGSRKAVKKTGVARKEKEKVG